MTPHPAWEASERMNRPFRQESGPGSRHTSWILCAACCLLLTAASSRAQEGNVPQAFTRSPVFKIPFSQDGNERRWRQVELYVSTDQGRTWNLRANVRPNEGSFVYTAEQDGNYWFATRTVDLDGRSFPTSMDNAAPQLKVVVDTQPPVITLRSLPPRDGLAQIDWELRDANLDLNSLEVDYRLHGSSDWLPLRVEPRANGGHSWRPSTNGRMEARLRVRDLARNESEQKVAVEPPNQGAPVSDARNAGNTEPLRGGTLPPAGTGSVPIRYVNNTTFDLKYKLKDVGKSGVSAMELWWTRDGRNWQKQNEKTLDRDTTQGTGVYPVVVASEGVYGFSLVPKSGVGFHQEQPRVDSPPQVWVEVDLTKPVVELQRVDVGRGSESGNLAITWRASDKNLGKTPITLSYAERLDGDYKPIQANLERNGRYVWRMPAEVPFEFHVRVEATDLAGNVGADQTKSTVKVDLDIPKIESLDVSPVKK